MIRWFRYEAESEGTSIRVKRIKELYELCGQVQTSIRWLEKPRDLFTHLLRGEPRRYAL